MKKISVMLVLSLLMCLIMVFPASAVTYQPTWKTKVMTLYDALQDPIASYKSEYPYELYFYVPFPWNTNNSTTMPAREQLYVVLSKNPNLVVNDTAIVSMYALNSSGAPVGSYMAPNSRTITQIRFTHSPTVSPAYTLQLWPGISVAGYYVADLSTGTFSDSRILPDNTGYYDYTITVNPSIDISSLEALISQAKAIENIGYTPSSWQNLQTQITAAESLLSTSGYTQTQVDNEVYALQTALDGLVILPDITVLQSLLVEADEITDIGYTPPTWNRFKTARSAGHSLVARDSYTESEVSAVSTELSSSMAGLVLNAIIPPPVSPFDPNGYNLLTGDIMGYLSPITNIYYSYVLSVKPIWILYFSIVLGILLLPKLFVFLVFIIKR